MTLVPSPRGTLRCGDVWAASGPWVCLLPKHVGTSPWLTRALLVSGSGQPEPGPVGLQPVLGLRGDDRARERPFRGRALPEVRAHRGGGAAPGGRQASHVRTSCSRLTGTPRRLGHPPHRHSPPALPRCVRLPFTPKLGTSCSLSLNASVRASCGRGHTHSCQTAPSPDPQPTCCCRRRPTVSWRANSAVKGPGQPRVAPDDRVQSSALLSSRP